MGTILIALTYMVANLALPVYYALARDRTLGVRVGSIVAHAD